MRLLLDTNVLVSAALFPHGRAAKAYEAAVSGDYEVVVPRYALDEIASRSIVRWRRLRRTSHGAE